MDDEEVDRIIEHLKSKSERTGLTPQIPLTRENVRGVYLGIFNVLDHIGYAGPDAEKAQEAAFELETEGVRAAPLGVSNEKGSIDWIFDDPESGDRAIVRPEDESHG